MKKRAIRDPTWFFTKMSGNSSFHSNERNYSKLALAMGSGSRTWDKGVSDAARNILCPKCSLELAAIQKTKQRIGSTDIGSLLTYLGSRSTGRPPRSCANLYKISNPYYREIRRCKYNS